MSLGAYAWMTLAFPLLGTLIISFGYRFWRGKTAGYLATFMLAGSFASALAMLMRVQERDEDKRQIVTSLYDYISTAGVHAKLALLVDPLSILIALVVTGVSTLIHLYSVAYLDSDRGYTRFFAYLNFFVFSMLLLVLAANFVLLIIGWAFVGSASYLLISFWYRRTTATAAGTKAFVINVLGDVGLVLGSYYLFKGTGTLDFLETFKAVDQPLLVNQTDLTAGCILLLVGAFAKSAQIPLHTWLADAMEGPTPVSALIHAATMVTAGVYLIARLHPLFEHAPAAADVGAIVGAITLIVAATIGLVVTDLKRIIAFSTMSQIGYMIMAVSAGAYSAGLFHLTTHAFFKALLFMAAGSVIAAMAGVQSLDKMGGFKRSMPFTYGCFIVGGLALSGIPPFSGFFSKDDILLYVGNRGGWFWVLYAAGYVGALLTAIYTFRMIFRVFHGKPVHEAQELEKGHLYHAQTPTNPANGEVEDTDVGFPGPDHHIAERAWQMKAAMGTLATLTVIGALLGTPKVTHILETFLEPTFADSRFADNHPSDTLLSIGLGLGALVGFAGIAIAYLIWIRKPAIAQQLQQRLRPLHTLFVNRWWFDELITLLFVTPAKRFGAFAYQTFERIVIRGGLIGLPTGLVRLCGAGVRSLQNGLLRSYVALMLTGTIAVLVYFMVIAR